MDDGPIAAEARLPQGSAVATLATVARRVGVSSNTVSRALRAPQTVRPELRQRIDRAMEELNYVPNRLAGGLAGTRSDIVGVIVTTLHYSEFAALVDALQQRLLEQNLQVMVANSRYDEELELRLVRSILSWRPAAMAVVGVDHHPKVTALLAEARVPVVEMWDTGGPLIDSAVGMDHEAIGWAQADHLLACGCSRLAFLGSVRVHDARARKRMEGAARRVAEAGAAPLAIAVRQHPGHPDMGDELVRELLDRHPEIDGILCNNDAVAFGVLRGLKALGRRVPDDCSLVGFGDNEAGSCMSPPLTTIRPDREALGRLTADVVLARIAGQPSRRIEVAWDLLERGSTRAA